MNRRELAEQLLINIASSYAPNDSGHLNADAFGIADAFIAEAERREQSAEETNELGEATAKDSD